MFAAVQFPGKISLSNTNTGVTQILDDPANVGTFGLRFGRARVFGHEETVAYTPNFLDSDSKAVIMNSNILVQAPAPVVKPYATAGMGTVISWGTGLGDVGTKFAVNYGGGLKIRPAGPVGVRIDARGYSIFGIQSQTLRVAEVSVGVLFSF